LETCHGRLHNIFNDHMLLECAIGVINQLWNKDKIILCIPCIEAFQAHLHMLCIPCIEELWEHVYIILFWNGCFISFDPLFDPYFYL
jgi:hypothetical protein